MYADWAYYSGPYGGRGPREEVEPLLGRASDAVDALTFSRINAIGWEGLTDFQRERVRRACCVQADFLLENGDAVDGAFREYAINGVRMSFGNDSLYRVVGGVAVSNAAHALLRQTGLAALIARPQEVGRALA